MSRFAGASRELTEALIVHPNDVDGVADTLIAALNMPVAEQRQRMCALRRHVAAHNVYEWAGRMLIEASQLRQREQMSRRLTSSQPHADVINACRH